MTIPAIYLDAAWRNVTPADEGSGRIGVGFDIEGYEPVRLALTLEGALAFAATLIEHITVGMPSCLPLTAATREESLAALDELRAYKKTSACSQRPMSALISSESKSVPSAGDLQ